jgi:hypothetical protein
MKDQMNVNLNQLAKLVDLAGDYAAGAFFTGEPWADLTCERHAAVLREYANTEEQWFEVLIQSPERELARAALLSRRFIFDQMGRPGDSRELCACEN